MSKDNASSHSTSALLKHVVDAHQKDVISVAEIKNSLSERGFGVLLAIFALPLCLPFPAPPGYTTIFSIPLFILATQMIYGADTPWLPKWLSRREISRKKLGNFIEKAIPLLQKMERFLRPRFINGNIERWEKLIGISSFVFALSIAIPLPLTNLPPGYGILIMSLGLLSKDGITILIGLFVGLAGVVMTFFIVKGSLHLLLKAFESTPEESSYLILHQFMVFVG